MIPYNLALAGGTVVAAWLLALVALRSRRPWLKATYAALALTFIINGAAYVGTTEGFLSAAWESTVLWSMILAHPLTAILVLSLIHGESVPRRRPMVLLLLVVPELFVLTPSVDWAVRHVYEPNPLGAFLIVCLGIALAEPLYERLTSSLLAADSFWLSVGVVALIIGGPVYNYEFDTLGFTQAAGSNLGAPVALAVFAYVAFHADPFPATKGSRTGKWSDTSELPRKAAIVFDEERPAYALQAVRAEASQGRPALVVGRQALAATSEADPWAVSLMAATRYGAQRTQASVSEFLARHPGGVVALPDLADVVMMSGWGPTKEMVLRLGQVTKDTRSTLVLSPGRLTEKERRELKDLPLTWWTLPDPPREIEALLASSFGSGARELVSSFCRAKGIRRHEMTAEQVPALLDFLQRAIVELSGSVADASATQGLHVQSSVAMDALKAFAARSPEDLSRGDWPSKGTDLADRELVVTASGYWRGKELDELVAAVRDLPDKEPLFERTRSVFVEQLGDAGEGVLRSELAKLGRKPEELRPEDVGRLADRAAVDLSAMADVVDLPQEKVRIRGQIDTIRKRLEAIAGDQS